MTSQNTILTNVIDKLDQLPFDLGMTDTDIVPSLNDALREMGTSLANVPENSKTELYLEIRTQYYALSRIQNSQAINFRYSTGVDGKSVDKSMIPGMIGQIMDNLNTQFMAWFNTSYSRGRSGGGIWTKTFRENTRLAGDT